MAFYREELIMEKYLIIMLLLLFPIAVTAADENKSAGTPDVTDLIVQGEFKKAIELTTDAELKANLNKLLNINQLVADSFKPDIGKEITIPIRGKDETGILAKIKDTTLYVKVSKGPVTATWPVKVVTLPIELRMEKAGISENDQNLYFGAKAFHQKNYPAAAYYFRKTGPISKSLLDSADKQCKYIISLAAACEKRDLEKMKELLEKGADPNGEIIVNIKNNKTGKVESKASTILIETIKYRNNELIKLLLKNGADVNKPNSSGVTPLMFAIMSFPDDTEIMEFLLNHQADFRHKDKDGNTPLTGAVAFGRMGAVKALLKYGADVNESNGKGFTPLMLAVAVNNPEMFKLLLEKGADVKKKHPKGWTVLEMDRKVMNPEIKAVLDKISPPKQPSTPNFPGFSTGGLNVVPKRR